MRRTDEQSLQVAPPPLQDRIAKHRDAPDTAASRRTSWLRQCPRSFSGRPAGLLSFTSDALSARFSHFFLHLTSLPTTPCYVRAAASPRNHANLANGERGSRGACAVRELECCSFAPQQPKTQSTSAAKAGSDAPASRKIPLRCGAESPTPIESGEKFKMDVLRLSFEAVDTEGRFLETRRVSCAARSLFPWRTLTENRARETGPRTMTSCSSSRTGFTTSTIPWRGRPPPRMPAAPPETTSTRRSWSSSRRPAPSSTCAEQFLLLAKSLFFCSAQLFALLLQRAPYLPRTTAAPLNALCAFVKIRSRSWIFSETSRRART